MGASALTIPDFLDEDAVKSLAGLQYQSEVFEQHCIVMLNEKTGTLTKSFPKELLVELGQPIDVYISYDGDYDIEGTYNHVRISKINAALQEMGFTTSFVEGSLVISHLIYQPSLIRIFTCFTSWMYL
jgi:hypothetical protein